MQLNISFRHIDHTESLDAKIKSKAEKFKKWFHNNPTVQWTCWLEDNTHISEVIIHDSGKDYVAKASANDLYKTFDLVISKIQNQIIK